MKNRLKTVAAPRTWSIKRKKNIWTMKPKGPHKIENSMPVSTLLRDHLKHAKTSREIKNIIHRKGILVDNKKIKNINRCIGLMDIMEIPELKEKYILLINTKGKLYLEKTGINFKIAKITGKTSIGKKIQLNLFGGKNIIVDKDVYKVGDTVIAETKDFKIKEHIKFAEGSSCMLLGGSHIGEFGTVKKIEEDKIVISGENGNEFDTLKRFVYIVGKDKPLIKEK